MRERGAGTREARGADDDTNDLAGAVTRPGRGAAGTNERRSGRARRLPGFLRDEAFTLGTEAQKALQLTAEENEKKKQKKKKKKKNTNKSGDGGTEFDSQVALCAMEIDDVVEKEDEAGYVGIAAEEGFVNICIFIGF